ncbi:WLM domain-containing protein [Apodospora peruviana]|uniref:WLM domain-containing protein n=1 Tax=Apodospora peruviana TaxID=516989 RepID=A0AAE0HYU4_9PEZI|nr:WLM domain-containing protein [Apodospora peruviana]
MDNSLSSPPVSPDKPKGSSPSEPVDTFKITINFTPEHYSEAWTFNTAPTLADLLLECQTNFPEYDWSKTKAMPASRRPGIKPLLKTPDDDNLSLSPLQNTAIKLMAPKTSSLESLQSASASAAALNVARVSRRINNHPRSHRPHQSQEYLQYTFHTLRPLPYLPNPARSLAFLERLRSDPGIRAAMLAHKFSVGLLTEMDPSQHTQSTHEGTTRILGLNRNKGEVIELRLRTDVYDGYRDYKTIRKTLCHELAHNVHSEHDRQFWDLTAQIEREVSRADWKSGGRVVGGPDGAEFAPERGGGEEEMFMDHGGWTGGTYVLGGGNGNGQGGGMGRREILARAAEQRLRNLGSQGQGQEKGKGGSTTDREGGGGSEAGGSNQS